MKKRIGILVDMSDLVVPLQKVAEQLASDGVEVVWLIESRIPECFHDLDLKGEKYYFSDFLRSEEDRDTEKDYGNCSHIMFSTYDRHVEFGRWVKDEGFFAMPRKLLRFFEKVTHEQKLDAFVYEIVSNPFAYAAYFVAKAFSIPYLGLISSRIPGRFDIYKDLSGNRDSIARKMESMVAEEMEQVFDDIKSAKYDYMKSNPTSYRVGFLGTMRRMSRRSRAVLSLMGAPYRDEFSYSLQTPTPLVMARTRIARAMKRSISQKRLDRLLQSPVTGEKYLVYPLHYHPEASTSIFSPEYVDENVVLKNIAFQVPEGVKLYVKEHPNAAGFKRTKYYKEIAQLPNVRLIDHRANTQSLIAGSLGVVTLTSTMGYEAALAGKRVFVFGDVFYTAHPLCKKIDTYPALRRALEELVRLDKELDVELLRDRFLTAYKYHTKIGRIEYDRGSPTFNENCKLVAKGLYEEITVPTW